MSCDHNRHKFFLILEQSGHDAGTLERTFQQNRRAPGNAAERLTAEAKTKKLFEAMRANGLKPPTHSANGLPRTDAQLGYAAVYDALQKNGHSEAEQPNAEALQQAVQLEQTNEKEKYAGLGLDGRDESGYDRWGYDRNGYDRFGRDRDGYNASGFGTGGRNRHGYDSDGFDTNGLDPTGYNRKGVDQNGLDRKGYNPETGLDEYGYDKNGLDPDGYDRDGYNKMGFDRNGDPDPTFKPDENGIYPDGFDAYGYRKDGFDDEGYDFYGFGRDGYNRAGVDRNGYDRDGSFHGLKDPDGYNRFGYRQTKFFERARDRLGYDVEGFDEKGFGWTGFDEAGKDKDGNQRKVLNPRTGNMVNAKYDTDGFDKHGYDKHGFNRNTGLTEPDEQGYRYNSFGWIYDEKADECYNPEDPSQRVKNEWRLKAPGRRKHQRVVSAPYRPPGPPPPITPRAKMSYEEYQVVYGPGTKSYHDLPRRSISYPSPESTVPQRRAAASSAHGEKAVRDGVLMRCSHCGQFTGGNGHNCPSFGGQEVTTYRSGMVFHANNYEALWTPHNPDYDPEFDSRFRSAVGYNAAGYDQNGFDANGYDQRGFDRDGYTREGFDVFGYDRDGFDRDGYNNAGFNRKGEKRGRSLTDASHLLAEEGGDQLANNDLARMYSQLATGLIGKPRRVVLQEGGGFSTDMKGTIKADPYPLGRGADPRHNLVVTRAGIYHELGHEQFTPVAVWEQILAVAEGKSDEGELGEAGRSMLPRFFNIVEDGRMERQVAGNYAGAAEILAASCRLQPRWGEEVGENVGTGDQVFWSLLYTSLPYYRVRAEVHKGMSPRARALFDELSPVVARAVRGEPEEAYRAALHLAKRFEEEGLVQQLPPQDYSQMMPGRGGSGRGQSAQDQSSGGQGSGQDGEEDEGGAGQGRGRPSGGEQEKERKGRQGGQGLDEETPSGRTRGDQRQEDEAGKNPGKPSGNSQDESTGGNRSASDQNGEENGSGGLAGDQAGQKGSGTGPAGKSGAGGDGRDTDSSGIVDDEDNEWLFGNEVVDAAVSAVERDAAYAIEAGVRGRSQPTTIGKPLHRPLPDEPVTRQRYRDETGMPVIVPVYLPVGQDDSSLQRRRERHREVASLMAKPLKAIREQAELRLRRQTKGRLDRRQLVNAYKGMEDVRTRTKEQPHTSFASSIQVDMSGSMSEHVKKKELYDAVMVLGDTFEMMDMPYEVRAFGSRPAQLKAMDEPFDTARAAYLAEGDLGGTSLSDTAALAHSSLLAREEKNRMMISLTDGSLHDHEATARTLRAARQNGIVTFGIFFGSQSMCDSGAMDSLYGKGNWTRVEKLNDMPKSVAQRLASIFKSLR